MAQPLAEPLLRLERQALTASLSFLTRSNKELR